MIKQSFFFIRRYKMNSKNICMFLALQPILFCLLMGCSKPSVNINADAITVNNDNDSTTDTLMIDTTINIDTTIAKDTSSVAGNLTWLALGDSYTIGESVSEE